MKTSTGPRAAGFFWRPALLVAALLAQAHLAFSAEVNGIWTDASTKDLGVVTGIKALDGIKTRGWISTYYVHRLGNHENQKIIPGRSFDIRDQSFSVELAELELEKAPAPGKAGFKLDLAAGDAMDQIFAGVTALHGAGALSQGDRYVQHATLGYVADVGKGLRLDAGKMVTEIGGETIESIKNNNFSHSYFFTYGIPVQHTGIKVSYPLHDRFTAAFMVYNGWNTTRDNDKGKSVHAAGLWNWGPLSGALNYMTGLESDTVTAPVGSRSTRRQLFDTQAFYALDRLNLGFNADYGDQNGIPVVGAGTRTVKWYGWVFYARYKVTDRLEPAVRWETYVDPNNFTTAQAAGPGGSVATRFDSLTVTLNHKCAENLLVRPEFRWDKANRRTGLFTDPHGNGISSVATLAANAIFYF